MSARALPGSAKFKPLWSSKNGAAAALCGAGLATGGVCTIWLRVAVWPVANTWAVSPAF